MLTCAFCSKSTALGRRATTCLLRVSASDAGIRAERAIFASVRIAPPLSTSLPERLPKSLIARYFRQGLFVDGIVGTKIDAATKLNEGVCIRILDEKRRLRNSEPTLIGLDVAAQESLRVPMSVAENEWIKKSIVWSDDDSIVVISKPPNIHTQRVGKGVGGSVGHLSSVDDALPLLAKHVNVSSLKLVHRLDFNVGGLMILAKTRACAESLTSAFAHGSALALQQAGVKNTAAATTFDTTIQTPPRIRKAYLGLVIGSAAQTMAVKMSSLPSSSPQSLRKGVVGINLRTRWPKASGTITADVIHTNEKTTALIRTPAVTRFSVISKENDAILLLLEPLTGRKHQLRQHCATQLGGPLVGDTRYGGGGGGGGGRGSTSLGLHCVGISIDGRLLGPPQQWPKVIMETSLPPLFTNALKARGLDIKHALAVAERYLEGK